MKVVSAYDEGAILPQSLLELDPSTILTRFQEGVRNIAALSLSAGYPIEATVPILIGNAFKNIAALSLESGYNFIKVDSKSNKLMDLPHLDLLQQLKLKPKKRK